MTAVINKIKDYSKLIYKYLSWRNHVSLWGLLFIFIGVMLGYLFTVVNSCYIDYINAGHGADIVNITGSIFTSYMNIVVFFVFYIICSAALCMIIASESTDYSLSLILGYLIIGILNQINDINIGITLWQTVFSIISDSLYEISVVPVILYITLKMKIHRKHMLVLVFCELIATVLYIIGTLSSESSALSLLKNVGCSVIFLVVFVVLFVFVALEFKDGNSDLEVLIKVEVVVLFVSAIIILFSLLFRNEYYNSMFNAFSSLLTNFDIKPIRRLVLQNILIFSVVGDLVVRYLDEYLFRREVRRTLEVESELAKEYAQSVRSRMDEVRTIKHDIKNHINMLNMYYSKGEYDKLGEYLGQLDTEIVEIRPLTYSKNRLVDYILMTYSEKFKAEGFEFSASAIIAEELPLTDSEVCSLITNMLSNALEACKNSKNENGGGFVRYKMTMSKSKIQIKCENSCNKKKNVKTTQNVLETEKPNGSASHGYGMGIIKNICEKHGGAVLFSAEDGVFTLNAVLPIDF